MPAVSTLMSTLVFPGGRNHETLPKDVLSRGSHRGTGILRDVGPPAGRLARPCSRAADPRYLARPSYASHRERTAGTHDLRPGRLRLLPHPTGPLSRPRRTSLRRGDSGLGNDLRLPAALGDPPH